MPPKKKNMLMAPRWVDALDNDCLWETVREALQAKASAIRQGAEEHKACRAVMRSADKTIDAIEKGDVQGTEACKKAAVAVRKYSTALECARPSARR